MPSKYEPCGLTQMFALKYGTIPIVRKTADLTIPCGNIILTILKEQDSHSINIMRMIWRQL